jgi:hypothetical protein
MYKYFIFSVLITTIFSACNQNILQYDKKKNLPEFSIKEYNNIDKDAILNAAKKVILLSDEDYNIKSYIDSIQAKRFITKFTGYSTKIEINEIILEVKQEHNSSIAKLTIKQKSDYFDKESILIKNGTHDLLWNRIDFILGKNEKWQSCLSHAINMNYDGVLCDRIYNDNTIAVNSDKILNNKITKTKDTVFKSKTNDLKDINLEELNNISLPIQKNTTTLPMDLEPINHKLPIIEIDTKLKNKPIEEINLEKETIIKE